MRWCTKMLKIKPFEKYVGDDEVMMYVGIRADEDRAAYISTKPNIKTVLPVQGSGLSPSTTFTGFWMKAASVARRITTGGPARAAISAFSSAGPNGSA